MKTLIIHPEDPTTTFLSPIYANLEDKTVITGRITKPELQELIESNDRVLMLGHGSPYGLLSRGQFPGTGLHIIDESMVITLKTKSNCIFIWCFADQFLKRYGLTGLCSGMFISEMGEAGYYGFDPIDQRLIDQSNESFSFILSKHINEPMDALYQLLLSEYEVAAKTNPIARFNLERLYIRTDGVNSNLIKEPV